MTALAGLRVLDLPRFIAGPDRAMVLGDRGAEVAKIEPPGEGEHARRALPAVGGTSLYTFIVDRNRMSLAIDLRSAAGKDGCATWCARPTCSPGTSDALVALPKPEGLPCAKVATIADVAAQPQSKHRGHLAEIAFGGQTVTLQGATIHLSATPLSMRDAILAVGAHHIDVLERWLGRDRSRIDALPLTARETP